jgi:hypothetical protein
MLSSELREARRPKEARPGLRVARTLEVVDQPAITFGSDLSEQILAPARKYQYSPPVRGHGVLVETEETIMP